MDREKFYKFVEELVGELNTYVFGPIYDHLEQNPSIRESLCPAFPFPKTIRVGLLKDCLAVEYIGPEVKDSEQFDIEGIYEPNQSVFDFLGIQIAHLHALNLGCQSNVMDASVFVGDSIDQLCDYFYDFTQIPSDTIMLNGYFDFSKPTEPTVVSNHNLFWTDESGALKIKHIDFLEIFPRKDGDVYYHSKDSFATFAQAILKTHVPKYQIRLHEALNKFIELINLSGTGETDITSFIEATPELLQIAFGTHNINPQIKLQWQYETEDNDLKPDFLIERMDGYCDILDFKLPYIKSKPIVGIPSRRQPSFEIDSAIAQVTKYKEWCSQVINQKWLEGDKGIKVLHPQKYLIIGHSDEFSADDRQKLKLSRDVTVLTYDEFIEMVRFQIYRIR